MLNAVITQFEECTTVRNPDGESEFHKECKNTIHLDSDSIFITSEIIRNDVEELCTVFFTITPELIKELKIFIQVAEHQLEVE